MNIERLDQPLAIPASQLQNLIEADQLFELLAVACKMRLFDSLSEACTAAELAKHRHIDETTTQYLLDVLAYAGYLEAVQGLYKNSPVSETYLHTASLAYLGHNFMVQTGDVEEQLMRSLTKPGEAAAGPEPEWNPEKLRQIGVTGLLGSIQATVSAVNLAEASRLLDLGGGHGFYSIAFAQKHTNLHVTLFDLAQVIPLADSYIQQFGVQGRVLTRAGNFLTDAIGTGFDAVLCANILHREKRETVLPKVYNAINPGGRIIVKCRIVEAEKTLSAALAKLLWYVRGGKEFLSLRQWCGMLEQYGFTDVGTVLVDGIFATIVAKKP